MKVEGAGVSLAVTVAGEGAATVLVHGMGGQDPEPHGLPGRVITYDRRGYGSSEAPEPYSRTIVQEQTEDLVALVRAVDAAPALLVGRDFGALVVLDALQRHPAAARAAVLVDPLTFALVPQATEALSQERAALEDHVRARGLEEAVRWWRGGRAPAPGGARSFFADYAGLATLPLTRSSLRAIAVRVAVVASPGAAEHVRAAAEALARILPGAPPVGDDWRAAVLSLTT